MACLGCPPVPFFLRHSNSNHPCLARASQPSPTAMAFFTASAPEKSVGGELAYSSVWVVAEGAEVGADALGSAVGLVLSDGFGAVAAVLEPAAGDSFFPQPTTESATRLTSEPTRIRIARFLL